MHHQPGRVAGRQVLRWWPPGRACYPFTLASPTPVHSLVQTTSTSPIWRIRARWPLWRSCSGGCWRPPAAATPRSSRPPPPPPAWQQVGHGRGPCGLRLWQPAAACVQSRSPSSRLVCRHVPYRCRQRGAGEHVGGSSGGGAGRGAGAGPAAHHNNHGCSREPAIRAAGARDCVGHGAPAAAVCFKGQER